MACRAASAVGVAVALLVGLAGASSVAAPVPALLTWEAPDGCPSSEEVLDDVARTVLAPAAVRASVIASARVVMGPNETWRATVVLDVGGAHTERQFEAESCGAVAAATALIIAIAIDGAPDAPAAAVPLAAPPAPAPPPEPAPPPAPPAAPPPAAPPQVRTAPPAARARGLRNSFIVNAIVDWKTMPSPPAGGIEVALARIWRSGPLWLRPILGVEYFPSHPPAQAPYIGAVQGDFSMAALSGRACAGLAVSAFEFGPCAGIELVAMHASQDASVFGEVSVATETLTWYSLLASFVASWSISDQADLVLRADVLRPNRRETFGLDGNVIYDYVVSRGAVRGALGLAVRF